MPGRGLGGSAADARKKQAKRVTSYVLLAETIARVGIQVGGMLDQHPYDRVLCRYARELGRLHARLFSELTAPPGAESLHRKFTEAIKGFAAAAEAYCAADYPTAAKHRQKCIREFNKSLIELIKMKQRGTIP
jgi:hypothetical protein